jgi:hypothetical protein
VGSARLHSRAMNKVVVFRPACRAMVQGSTGLTPGQRVKRVLHMHLASPTSPAQFCHGYLYMISPGRKVFQLLREGEDRKKVSGSCLRSRCMRVVTASRGDRFS